MSRPRDEEAEAYKRAREKRWREENPSRQAEYSARWKSKDPESAKASAQRRAEKYRASKQADPSWVIRRRISARMSRSLKSVGGKKRRGWESLVGYTLEDLRCHLERLFLPGMTWQNMGHWHIDHVRPVSSFNITNCDDLAFRECWSLSNLQPLWAVDNLKKYNKLAA